MIKVKNILNASVPVISGAFLTLFVVFSGLAIKDFIFKKKQIHAEEICIKAYKMLCVKAFGCNAVQDIKSCDDFVIREGFCEVKLPDNNIMQKCEEDLRGISCDQNMPASCMTFMKD